MVECEWKRWRVKEGIVSIFVHHWNNIQANIFVAIERDDLLQYEENERIVPIESRIPAKNMLLINEPKSSADTLAEVILNADLNTYTKQMVRVVF